jgi:hypothetical protein
VFADETFETADVNNPIVVAAGDWALYPDPQITRGPGLPGDAHVGR